MNPRMDPHKLLCVEQGSSEEALKSRFKTLRVLFHPDKLKNDPTSVVVFQLIQEAYRRLTSKRDPPPLPPPTEEPVVHAKKSRNLPAGNHVTTVGHTLKDPWFQQDFSLEDYFADVKMAPRSKHS